jgi:hypothetical protein
MAEELQYLPAVNAADSTTGRSKKVSQSINNIIIRIERFRTFVKQHSTV